MPEIIPWYEGDAAEQVRNYLTGGPNTDQIARNMISDLMLLVEQIRDDGPDHVIDGGSPNTYNGA